MCVPGERVGGVHPGTHAGHQETPEQDLCGVVDEQRDGDDGHLWVTFKHDLQDGDAWPKTQRS